jgi:hypothetical protein
MDLTKEFVFQSEINEAFGVVDGAKNLQESEKLAFCGEE